MMDTEQMKKIIADVSRANAKKVFTVKCTACGKGYTQNFSWLQKRRFICPSCNGRLDDYPLHQLTLLAMRKFGYLAKPPKKKAFRQVELAPAKQFDAAEGY